jgi:MFS family permease
MQFRRYFGVLRDPIWLRVISLSLTLFFVMTADAIISYWVPNLLETSLKSSALMGIIVGFQSIVGFGADLIFPQLLRLTSVKRFVLLAIFSSIITSLLLLFSATRPLIIIFLLAMAIWGVYYEFLNFASQQFVADMVPINMRPGAWGVLGVFKNLAYFIGPMLGAWLILSSEKFPSFMALFLAGVALLILIVSGKTHERPMEIDIKEVNIVAELNHWTTLFTRVWPMIVLSLFLGFIDATFWVTGAIWTQHLAQENFWGSFFLPLYALPSLFMGFVVAKWGIYTGKKKIAEIFLLAAGIFLAALGISSQIFWQLLMVFLSSSMLAIVYPFGDGVYSDLIARLGRERKHMIGLTSSVVNISYIIWPIVLGFAATRISEEMIFSYMGILTIIISIILLFVTPRKLKLPQEQIRSWKD